MIPFNAFIHNMTQDAQLSCLRCCREHLHPGGALVFDLFFPSVSVVGAEPGVRDFEGEITHTPTGRKLRMYDTRSFDRVEQTQHSLNEMELEDEDGNFEIIHRSTADSRYIYKQEMALLLQLAGFPRWKICGGFDGRPLTNEDDAMIVHAWAE
jgi:hypothetical protein